MMNLLLMSLTSVVMLFAFQTTIIPDDVLQVDCAKHKCQGRFTDYNLKHVDNRLHALFRDGRLTVTYGGTLPIYDDLTEITREFIAATDEHGRRRKLSSVKSICVIGTHNDGGGCTTVRKFR